MAEARRRLIAGVRLARKLAPWLASLALSLALTEAALRITGFASHQVLHASPPQAMFMGFDEDLGWSFTPNASGVFSNGYFAGAVTIDAHGNRRNAPAGTYREGFRDILFIGDSTTASFEVDDAETVPALLERGLRDRGHDVNVVNLGVRGYSTGQSVRKAIGVAARFAPTDIVYLFVDNDIAGNNLIKRARKPLAKGIFIRRDGGGPFESLGYPVPRLPIAYGAVVMFDGACRPLVHEYNSLEAETVRAWRTTLNRWLRNNVFVYGAIRFIVRSLTGKPDNYDHRGFGAAVDPYDVVVRDGGEWNDDFIYAYGDGGSVRNRCGAYFDAQIGFLLGHLRARIPSLRRLHLVQYPDTATIDLLRRGQRSANTALFAALRAEGLVDSYVDLPRRLLSQGIDVDDLRCMGDAHFCADGTTWIASQILDGIAFE